MADFYWIWKIPVALAAAGYITLLLIWNSSASLECAGYRWILTAIVLSILTSVMSIFVVFSIEIHRKVLKVFFAVSGGLLSLPLLVPVMLSLGGIHAADNVCNMATLDDYDSPPSVHLIQAAPYTPLHHEENAIPARKPPCFKEPPVGYSLGSNNCSR